MLDFWGAFPIEHGVYVHLCDALLSLKSPGKFGGVVLNSLAIMHMFDKQMSNGNKTMT